MTANQTFATLVSSAEQRMAELRIPGVALGAIIDGQRFTAGLGITSTEHPLPVTDTTLFQVGSISKTFCATLVQLWAEREQLDLDVPLRTYLPELRLADPDVAERVTLRHCLTHTAGWLGDFFDDTGNGDDALALMVQQLARLPQLTPLGSVWSYNNAAFYLAGRVLEVVSGQSYEQLARRELLEPLGMATATFFAADAITHRTVVGHQALFGDETGPPPVLRPWALARNANAVGGLVCSVAELLNYAEMHLGMRAGPLSAASISAMQQPQAAAANGEQLGLSWFLAGDAASRIVKHGGATKGQQATLQLVPAQRTAFVALTNSDRGSELYQPLVAAALQAACGIAIPEPQPISAADGWNEAVVGRYTSALSDCVISARDGTLWAEAIPHGGFPTPDTPPSAAPPPTRLAWLGPDALLGLDPPFTNARAELLRDAAGTITWLRIGGRVHKRV